MGGLTKDSPEVEIARVHCFNQCREEWQTRATTGDPPPGFYLGTSTTTGHHLYVYGGCYGNRFLFMDSFHQLDMDTLEWSQLPSGPMSKGVSGMVSYKGQLILFGGYGTPSGPTQPGTQFIGHGYSCGWTNELHSFNLKEGEKVF